MSNHKPFKLPVGLLVLDGLGTVLVGLGLAKMFGNINVLPASLQPDETGWTFIIIGGLLMLPFILFFFSKVRERAEKKIVK